MRDFNRACTNFRYQSHAIAAPVAQFPILRCNNKGKAATHMATR
jgi:hypothetical protein